MSIIFGSEEANEIAKMNNRIAWRVENAQDEWEEITNYVQRLESELKEGYLDAINHILFCEKWKVEIEDDDFNLWDRLENDLGCEEIAITIRD